MMAPGRLSRPALEHLPLLLVLAAVGVGFVRIAQYHWREGAVLIGGALLVAAVLRATLTSQQNGLLVIRGRGVDVLVYTALGLMILFVALTINRSPG